MLLEKDPQQEDFLQGRMLGNPYSSNEPGPGPLMRDVKNKICQGKNDRNKNNDDDDNNNNNDNNNL